MYYIFVRETGCDEIFADRLYKEEPFMVIADPFKGTAYAADSDEELPF